MPQLDSVAVKKLLVAFVLVSLPAVVRAGDISVGGTVIAVPAPPDFAPIADGMKPFSEFAKRFVPPSNEQFALFLPAADVALAAKGGMPTSERKFYVQTVKSIIGTNLSTADFAQLKDEIKTQNVEGVKKAQAEFPEFFDKVNKGITDDYKVDLKLAVSQMLPLPPHRETPRSLAYSMIVRVNANGADGKPAPYEGVVTTTFVHLRGKVLFLYVNAEKSGLAWSRLAAQAWVDAVVAANPSSPEETASESAPAQSGFNWSGVLRSAVIGGIVGGLAGGIGYLLRKKKTPPLPPQA